MDADGRAKELAEEADREREAREIAVKTTNEKIKVVDIAEKKADAVEKKRAMAKKRSAELLAKQNKTDVKLAEEISLNTAQAEEEACEEKWYNEGFVDAENSAEPIVNQARRLGFEAGWFTALQILGVPEDFPLRDPNQIPFSSLTAAAQNPLVPIDEEETISMRELVEQIDAHAEPDETEATSIPSAQDQPGGDLLPPVADQQQTEAADQTRPFVPSS